jgi:hypothetical protein
MVVGDGFCPCLGRAGVKDMRAAAYQQPPRKVRKRLAAFSDASTSLAGRRRNSRRLFCQVRQELDEMSEPIRDD